MLRRDEQFPIVRHMLMNKRTSVTDEVPQNMFFEMSFAKRWIASAEAIEARQQAVTNIANAAIDSVNPTPATHRIRIRWRDMVEQFANALHHDFLNRRHTPRQ